MNIIFDGKHKNKPWSIRLTKFDNNIMISTIEAVFLSWYGKYETAIFFEDKNKFAILESYDNIESALAGHEKYINMTEKELRNFYYL